MPVAELSAVIERVRKMAGALDGVTGADPSEEAGAVAAAAKEVQAAARLASRPYAARRLPDRRDSSAGASDSADALVAKHPRLRGGEPLPGVKALDFSAIIVDKRGQHLQGTREWVFDAVEKWRKDPKSAKLFWLVGGGGTGKSVAAAELLARLLDKQKRRGVALLQAHGAGPIEPGRAVAVVGGHALCFCRRLRGRAEGERRRQDGQGRRALRGFNSKTAAKRRRRPRARACFDNRRARRAAARRAEASAVVARERAEDAAAMDQTRRDEPRRGAD